MSTALSYADAVKVLGGGKPNKVVEALDRLTGGALLVMSATGSALALSLFDAKSEFFRLTGELVSGLTRRLRDTGPAERGEQLVAAHSVIVVAAFFDVMASVRLPFDFAELELSRTDGLTTALLRTPAPTPAPHRPYEKSIEALREYYDHAVGEVLRFLTGLDVWDRLDGRERHEVRHAMTREVSAKAVTRYEDLFRRLVTDFPEFAFWANAVDHQATRTEIGRLRTALAGVAQVLSEIAAGRAPDEHRLRLAEQHQKVLHRPLLRVAPQGVRLPSIAEAYVNPRFRVAADAHHEHIANEEWWGDQPVRADLQEFLVGHLTSPAATEAPLVVLGQPGSGKSTLTKVLAASLPASEFVAVQVPLREVSADRDVQVQIEEGLRITTGEDLRWRDFVRSAGDALPVVLLDGFDELVQATKVSQSNYLDLIAAFQQREALNGYPVVVVVTSRVSVADRARPVDGMVSLLLEPFSDEQIEQWLGPWRRVNDTELTADVLRPYAHLARQPLLLLLLAIYDRTEKPLYQHGHVFGQTELYERLLAGFAKREVLKQHANEPDDVVARFVEEQLVRLSVAAFAMFNRARQWVSAEELDADLAALPITAFSAQIVIGSFYFVHTDQAMKDDDRLCTYEFMHPTFGEYLIARLAVVELFALTEGRRDNDDFLHALLSFAPLTARKTVATFIVDIIAERLVVGGKPVRETLLSLFHAAQLPRRSFLPEYRPGRLLVPARCAVYTANLCVLLVLVAPGSVTADELFPDVDDPVQDWSGTATLWMSQLRTEERHGLVEALDLVRAWEGDRRVLRISRWSGGDRQRTDPYWIYRVGPSEHSHGVGNYRGWTHIGLDVISAELEFLCSVEGDTAAHALSPFLDGCGSMVTTFYAFGDGRPVSAAHALISLWLKADGDGDVADLASEYDTCLLHAVHGFAPNDTDTRRRFRILFLNQLQRLRRRLPVSTLDHTVQVMCADSPEVKEQEDLLALVREICPGLLD
jgi:hypothetical protein